MIAKRPPDALFSLTTDQWTAPFWQGTARHALLLPRCADCGQARMPPLPFCPACHSQSLDWVPLSGRGRVYSYTIVSRAQLPEQQDCLPYVPAVITLEGGDGCRLVSNLVDLAVARVEVDLEVTLLWHDRADGVTLPLFTG